MSAHVVFLKLLNELEKRDKMRGMSIFSLSCNEYNKFNNTRARMLDYIYHMTLKLLENSIFVVEMSRFPPFLSNFLMGVITLRY